MSQIPKIIHQIWLGENPLPREHNFYRETIKFFHPGWDIKLWDDNALIKSGINVKKIDSFFWNPASASNLIRLLLLERLGGIYLDTDVQCFKSLEPLLPNQAFAALQDGDRICNAVMGSVPDHQWIKWQITRGPGNTDPHDAAWGVYTASEAPRDGLTIIPTEWVYPFHYTTPILDRMNRKDAYLVHHWGGSWTK